MSDQRKSDGQPVKPSDSGEHHRLIQLEVGDVIAKKEARKLRARRRAHPHVWFGLGMFGLVGWSVAIPTLLGAALGIWLDARWEGRQSWTLMLLFGGLILGCLNAWRWLRDESEVRDD